MTLQELRRSGRDGVYDPITDQYYFVGEEPSAKAAATKTTGIDTPPVAVVVDVKKTDAASDVKPAKKTEDKVGK